MSFTDYGIAAEFNPFHNGHKYLIDKLKKNPASTVTAVMSENFVQRGDCAVADIGVRARAALENGVDLVLSLPVNFAVSSAERFAYGGIATLDALGALDCVAFGSESGNTSLLKSVAEIIEADEFSKTLENRLSEGLSFPTARQRALGDMYGKEFAAVLSSPNDILGVEYIKALNKLGSRMHPRAVKRSGAMHDSEGLFDGIASASHIRSCGIGNSASMLPESSFEIFSEAVSLRKAPADYKKLETAILAVLRCMSPEDIRNVPDVTEGLEYRIFDAVRTSSGIEEILEKVKTKRYTHSRLRRIVLCAFLGITKNDAAIEPCFIRVLGFNEKGAQILKKAKKKAALPIVTRSSDFRYASADAARLFELECRARDLYSLSLPETDICGREMTDKLLRI